MKLLSVLPLSACLATLLLSSCNDEIKPINNGNEDKTVNEWIVNSLEDKYLWNDEVKEKDKNYNTDPEELFYSLLSLNDGKVENRIHYPYSYIKSTTESRAINTESTYGFEFILYNIIDNGSYTSYNWARVLYVLPDSPAEKAGLKRGDWIMYLDGQIITTKNYTNLYNGGAVKLGLNNWNNPDEISLEASLKINENPILLDSILKIGNNKIGYLVYNKFATGPNDNHDDKTYDNQLINIFTNKFVKEDINELVLDLRYNLGGYLSSATVLGGLIIPEKHKNDVFCYTRNNKDKYQTYKFTDSKVHPNLSRVYILVSSMTASASEAIINGLSPYMEVILIGNQTEGKNVGSETIESTKYDWELHPITVQIYNKDYNSEYAEGFEPDYDKNELNTEENISLYPLGDTREYYLNTAISLITGYPFRAKAEQEASSSPSSLPTMKPLLNSLERKKVNAVLID